MTDPLLDPSAWNEVPGGDFWDGYCTVVAMKSDRIDVPVFQWESCGTGCESADLAQGLFEYSSGLTLSSLADKAYLLVGQKTKLVQKVNYPEDMLVETWVRRIVDLNDGKTIGMLLARIPRSLEYSTCSLFRNDHSAFAVDVFKIPRFQVESARVASGVFDLPSGNWHWKQPYPIWEDVPRSCSSFVAGEGSMVFVCGSQVLVQISRDSSIVSELDSMGDYVAVSGAGTEDLAAWSEIYIPTIGSRVRGWANDGKGVRTLISRVDGDSCGFGASNTSFGGVLVRGTSDEGCMGFNPDARFWIAEHTDGEGPSEPTVRIGPVISSEELQVKAEGIVATAGEFLATTFRSRSQQFARLAVTRSSDWAVRWFDSLEAQREGFGSFALTPRHLYFARMKIGAEHGRVFRIYRYDLTKFSEIGSPD